MAKDDLRMLPIKDVRPNECAFMSVNNYIQEYIGFVDSIKSYSIINPDEKTLLRSKSISAIFAERLTFLVRLTPARSPSLALFATGSTTS